MKYIKNTPFGFFAETCAMICSEVMNIWMYLVKYTNELYRILQKMTNSTIFRYLDRVASQMQILISKVQGFKVEMSAKEP